MGRDDNYRCGLAAHPGRSKGAARYDVGLMAHNHRRPALTDTSPRGSPYPEPPNLPSPALPDQRRPTAHRHTRYDGMGSRVSTEESGTLTYYDWDGLNVLQEKDSDNTVTGRQVHGYTPVASVGDIALMDKRGTPYVPVPDVVGTIWGLAGSGAVLASSYTYDAFGVCRCVSETVPNRYRFGTRRRDDGSDLYHFAAGQYSPGTGRFSSSGISPTGTDYGYAGANPGRAVTPTGLPTKPCGLTGGMLAEPSPRGTNLSRVTMRPDPAGTLGLWHISGELYFKEDQKCCERPRIVQVVRSLQSGYRPLGSTASGSAYTLDVANKDDLPLLSSTYDLHRNDPVWEQNQPDHIDPVLYPDYSITVPQDGPWVLSFTDDPGFQNGWRHGHWFGTNTLDEWGELCMVCFDLGRCGTVLGCTTWEVHGRWTYYHGLSLSFELREGWHPMTDNFRGAASPAIAAKCTRLRGQDVDAVTGGL